MKYFTNVNDILLVDDIVEFFYIHTDFLFSCSISCWEKDIEISKIVDLSLSPLKSIFSLYIFSALLFGTYTFRIAISSQWIDSL